jgi:hypothetical protein
LNAVTVCSISNMREPVGRSAWATPEPIFAAPHRSSAISVETLWSWLGLHVGRPLVKIFAPLSKSITAFVDGLGTPFAAVVVDVLATTFSVAGAKVFFGSFFGAITVSIDCVLPSGPDTVGPARATEAVSAASAKAAVATTGIERLGIEFFLQ